MVGPLSLEEQQVLMSDVIRATHKAIVSSGMDQPGWKYDKEVVKLLNLFNMEQKALTEIQRALMMQRGKGRKTRLVNDLTEQTRTSPDDAAA